MAAAVHPEQANAYSVNDTSPINSNGVENLSDDFHTSTWVEPKVEGTIQLLFPFTRSFRLINWVASFTIEALVYKENVMFVGGQASKYGFTMLSLTIWYS